MKNTLIKTAGAAAFAILMTMMIAQIQVSGQETPTTAHAEEQSEPELSGRSGNRNKLIGTWDVQVTVRNCQTGAAFRTFPAIATFTAGGTTLVSESGIAPALKTPAHGVWSQDRGNRYSFQTKAFNFDASGNFTGWIIINNDVRLNHDADEFESVGAARVFAPNGNLVFTGCSTLAAVRFE